jgi:hypothetical protein
MAAAFLRKPDLLGRMRDTTRNGKETAAKLFKIHKNSLHHGDDAKHRAASAPDAFRAFQPR